LVSSAGVGLLLPSPSTTKTNGGNTAEQQHEGSNAFFPRGSFCRDCGDVNFASRIQRDLTDETTGGALNVPNGADFRKGGPNPFNGWHQSSPLFHLSPPNTSRRLLYCVSRTEGTWEPANGQKRQVGSWVAGVRCVSPLGWCPEGKWKKTLSLGSGLFGARQESPRLGATEANWWGAQGMGTAQNDFTSPDKLGPLVSPHNGPPLGPFCRGEGIHTRFRNGYKFSGPRGIHCINGHCKKLVGLYNYWPFGGLPPQGGGFVR